MSEPTLDDILFSDIVKKSTNVCFLRCVNDPSPNLTGKQKSCIKNCVLRFMECREATLQSLKELSQR
ncbi:unnamed protein product [Blepharisma stoltei]|uniref:Mitochondrial import inner membrane translocase subunit n=1 Tax=Blepharisma stoltei TaxID=1481888 RepID=A0AAU9J997_9CILI|nr:unnamed protein product [Blepharisma stoltei]